VYAAAIGELDYTPATVLPDIPLTLTDDNGDEYTPRNFDDKYRGPVRLREALGNSLNVPAVYTASELGAPTLLRTLHGFGFDSLRRSPEYYGPALALGDGEVTLLELVRAYATLARSGNLLPLHAVLQWESRASPTSAGGGAVQSYVPPPGSTAISTVAATLVTDMLADNRARAATFGLESPIHFDVPVAAKTGTSKNYRDNWVLGYSKRVTVGVWVGNFDGSPMREVSGITGAGPVFRAIMASALTRYPDTEPLVPIEPQLSEPSAVWSAFPAAAHPHDDQELPATSGIRRLEICPFSGQRRGAQCPHGLEELVPSSAVLRDCEWHRRVAIDRRNGLLAGPSCPSSVVVEKQFEALPNLYRAWAKSEQRESAPDAYSPHCPAPATDGTAREQPVITEPASGARYVIDPERPARAQQLTVAVLAPASTHAIQLLLDGVALWYSTRPFEFQWVLQPGEHRFVARDMDGKQSEPVLVHVRTTGE
jgi:penicillin-binding protein 1C